MPPPPGGWGGGGAGGGGSRGGVRGNRGGGDGNKRDEIRKFLNFYKRRNSVCVDLYQPAFYNKKPNWEDLADFVYAVRMCWSECWRKKLTGLWSGLRMRQ